MKKIILLLAVFSSAYSYPYSAFSQSKIVEKKRPLKGAAQAIDSTRFGIGYGPSSADLKDLFLFEGIDYFNISFSDPKLQGKRFVLTSKEYQDKQLVRVDTVTKKVQYGSADSTLAFRVIARKTKADTVAFTFFFPQFLINRHYHTTSSNAYSLRSPAKGGSTKPVPAPIGKGFPLLAYSLPYADPQQPGFLFYCQLSEEGVPPEKWGETYGVPHYIVFELNIQ